MSQLILSEALAQYWQGEDVFALLRDLDGEVIRDKEGRQTLRFELDGRAYYRKFHSGVGWREIFKNWSQLKAPVLGARNEWLAINRIRELGLDTLDALAYGQRGWSPARRESFLVTAELSNTLSLAKYAATWRDNPPPPAQRRALIRRVAEIARIIHRAGINHRDLYICHFLLDLAAPMTEQINAPRLFLVDLHRAQIRHRVPRRWLVKDLASIYFSSLDIGLSRRDVLRFLAIYFKQPPRQVLGQHTHLLASISARAVKLYQRDFSVAPTLPFNRL